jgi:hypothetical protein
MTIVEKSVLARAVREAVLATDSRVTAFAAVRVYPEVVQATCAEVSITSCFAYEQSEEAVGEGAIVAPKTLLKLLKGKGTVELSWPGEGRLVVKGRASFELPAAMAPEDFPDMLEVPATESVPVEDFHVALAFAARAVSSDGREHLERIRFEVGKMVATDGYRLHVAHLENPGGFEISKKAVRALEKLSKKRDLKVSVGSGAVEFVLSGGLTVTARRQELSGVKFPPYAKIYPDPEGRCAVTFAAEALRELAATAQALWGAETFRIEIIGEENVMVGSCPETEFDESLPRAILRADFHPSSWEGRFVAAVSSRYLAEAIDDRAFSVGFGFHPDCAAEAFDVRSFDENGCELAHALVMPVWAVAAPERETDG